MFGFNKKKQGEDEILKIREDIKATNDGGGATVTKNEEETNKLGAKNEGAMPINVTIIDVWGTSAKFQTTFGVEKLIEGANLFLYNKSRNFKELMPEDTEDYKKYKVSELNSLINKTEQELEKARKEKREADSIDYEQQLRVYKGYKRSIELQGRGSYLMFDYDRVGGKPLFLFVRKGVFKLPVFFNVEIDTLYIPSEAKIKTGAQLLKENQEKNGQNDNTVKIIGIIILVILGILLLGSMYFSYKTSVAPIQTASTMANTSQLLAEIAKELSFHSDYLINSTNNITAAPNLEIVEIK